MPRKDAGRQRRETNEPAEERRPGVLFAFGRMVGFLVFAAIGLGILAAIVLLPAYDRMRAARYERDRASASVERLEAELSTKARLAEALPHDRELTIQLMAIHTGRMPADEMIYGDPALRPATLEQMIHLPEPQGPARPDGPLVSAAGRIENARTRRGLFAMSAIAMATALLLFAPPSCRRQQHLTTEDTE